MIDWLASFGAGLIRVIVMFTMLYASVWLTIKLADFAPSSFNRLSERARGTIGFLVWLLLFAGTIIVFGPALDVLQKFSCRDARDFEMCMDPPDPEYP